ncbi:hypothetical protein CC2G_014263 [Coprinopsis cinerea AmutBmut pab1-1]|nr:hypothetical protein CC2G_014263 [Coprinopsis cinerea AmutBmut pab1-1]
MPAGQRTKHKGKSQKNKSKSTTPYIFSWTRLPIELKEEILKHMDINQLLKLEAALGLDATPATEYPTTAASPPKEMYRRISLILDRFDIDPKVCLELMQRHEVIISGSCALTVVLDSDFKNNDIDMYVKVDHAGAFVDALLRATRYERARTSQDNKEYKSERNGIVKSYPLVHRITGKILHIMETSVCPISTVFAFHNTVLMNFIAYWGVVCAYGSLTCRRIGLFNSTTFNEGSDKKLTRAMEDSRVKYKERGIKMIWNYRGREDVRRSWADIRNHVCGQWQYCPETSRGINDAGVACLVFPEWRDKDIEVTMVRWRLATEGKCIVNFGMKLGWVHTSEGRCIWLL